MNNAVYKVGYLLIKELDIENANAQSGSVIYGSPSILSIKGSFHNLSRKLAANSELADMQVSLQGVLIASHKCEVLAQRLNIFKDYTFSQRKAAPSTPSDYAKLMAGKPPSIIQQAYCHTTMSFVVEVFCAREPTSAEKEALVKSTHRLIQQQPMAAGSVRSFRLNEDKVRYIETEDLSDVAFEIKKAYIIMDASTELQDIIDERCDENFSPLDALIEVCTLHHTPTVMPNNEVSWETSSIKRGRGFLSPITTGYIGISPLYDAGVMENSRAPNIQNQYVESVYGLGRWVLPHKLRLDEQLETAFWRYQYRPDSSLYMVTQDDLI